MPKKSVPPLTAAVLRGLDAHATIAAYSLEDPKDYTARAHRDCNAASHWLRAAIAAQGVKLFAIWRMSKGRESREATPAKTPAGP